MILTTLNGSWDVRPLQQFAQGFYPEQGWLQQDLPAHWQEHPELQSHTGKLVYRRRFVRPQLPPELNRVWLRLNGCFYYSRPFINGVDLGRHTGYFEPQEHEISAWLSEQNTLLVELESPDERNKTGKQLITGVFSHWDCIDPATNPGGIWLPIELYASGPARLRNLRYLTLRLDEQQAELRCNVELDLARPVDLLLRWTITPHNFPGAVQTIEQRRQLPAGRQELATSLIVRDPQPWWPYELGDPNLYQINLELLVDGLCSDARSVRTGLRRFELRRWIAWINGVRLFLRGSNYPPVDTRIARADAERCNADIELARRANMNMLRVHGHISHPALYEAADAQGMLLWQDFPLQWLYRRSIVPEARRQARAMAMQLGSHPSLVIWCMHNEPLFNVDTADANWLANLRRYASVFLFSWNRDVLDQQLQRTVRESDTTRPVLRASNIYHIPLFRRGTSTHFYFGWYGYYGPLQGFDLLRKQRLLRANLSLVAEFGAQSFPNLSSCERFMATELEQVDWEHLRERHQFQPDMLAQWLPWRQARSLPELIELTQRYQAMLQRFYIDRLRLMKYRPTGGILQFMFHDPNPAIQWSVLDYWRRPKASYEALRVAFSPCYAFALVPAQAQRLGQPVDLPIYAVNDTLQPCAVRITAQLHGPGGERLAQINHEVTLPADSLALRIEQLRLTPEVSGQHTLSIRMAIADGATIEHNYELMVEP